jgi:NAD(P)-dependent dehydrogenase (short-subunit alcohol dehydrogenase family)
MAVVVVTGCSSGIGAATARAFAARGDHVFAGVRRPASGDELRAAADAAGWNLDVLVLDVCDTASVEAAIARVLEATGRVDIVVNNAAVSALAAIEDTPDAIAHAIYDTNVLGPLRVIRAVVPAMTAQGGGMIVNVSSGTAQVCLPYTGFYASSKCALEGMSEALAFETHDRGIRVAVVEPGMVKTPVLDKSLATVPSPARPGAVEAWEVDARARTEQGMAAEEVADIIVGVATIPDPPFRTEIGNDTAQLLGARRSMDDASFGAMIRSLFFASDAG